MPRLFPLLFLTGCCVQAFTPDNTVVRIYEVQDLCVKLKIDELQLRDRLDIRLSQEGYMRDVADIRPQKGILVIRATPQAQRRIQQILVELGL